MKKIDSDALGTLQKSLGLSGAGSPITELADGIVDQALDVVPVIRRGRTQAATEGLYVAELINVHAAADSRTATLVPFQPTTTAIAPYPSPMDSRFDVWLLSASLQQTAGAGTLSAALFMNSPAGVMGLSTTGAAGIAGHTLAFWDATATENITFGLLNGANGPLAKLGFRLPRGITTQLVFASTSSEAATFACFLIMGVFPVALGQDVLV